VFFMGSPSSERGRGEMEKRHKVRIMSDYLMMRTEVRNGLWNRVMAEPLPSAGSPSLPAAGMDWQQAISFANRLSEQSGLSPCYEMSPQLTWDFACTGWRLPTEAEWEMAANGGDDTLYSGSNALDLVSWYRGNSDGGAHSPCTKKENALGFCDMSGNVEEWVFDSFGPYVAPHDEIMGGAVIDPTGALHARSRILRGGSYSSDKSAVRVSARKGVSPDHKSPSVGLRLVRRVQ